MTRGAALMLALAPVAATASDVELLAGAEGGAARGYVYAQPMLSFHLRGAWDVVLRCGLSYYAFDLESSAASVSSPGIEGGITLRFQGERSLAGIGIGYEVRETTWDYRAASDVELREQGPTLQAFILSTPTPRTHVDLAATYGHVNRYGWARLGLRRRIGGTGARLAPSLGGELTFEGNDEARTAKAGAVLDLAWLRGGASLQLRAGVAKGSGDDAPHAYVGVGMYRGF